MVDDDVREPESWPIARWLAGVAGLTAVGSLAGVSVARSLARRVSVEDPYAGEDFELLLAVAPERVEPLLSAWTEAFPNLPLTVIGRLVAAGGGDSLTGGWDHFR